MLRGSLVFPTCALLATAPAGCTSGECGEGTVRYGDRCVATDPFDKTAPQIEVDPPLHTREVGIARLTSNEPAMIYYTIDGSEPTLESPHEPDRVVISNVPNDAQLRYFAIDLAGNQSDEESRIWIIDRDGPAAPLDFKVQLAGSSRTVTWTPPPDPRLGGVVVARVEGPLVAPPMAGEKYEKDMVLSPGVTIVHAADTAVTAPTSINETLAAKPGMVRYVAWAYDNLYNYGPPAGDFALVPVPAQTGRLSITATGVTQMVAPANLTLGGTSTLTGSTLAAKITIKNDTTRVLFAPKLLVTAGAGSWTNADGTFATFPYRAFGAAILPGGTASQTLTFSGASAGTTITLDVDVRDNTIVTSTTRDTTTAGRIVDFATGALVLQLQPGPTGPNGGAMTMRGGITPDGRVVVGARTSGTVSTFDLATGKRVLGATLAPQKSHVAQVILDKSGSAAYALLAEGHPQSANNTGGSQTELVRLDAATLGESGRLPIDISRNRDIAISADGRTLLVATGVTAKGVVVVDLPTFTIRTRLLPGFRTQAVMFSPDGGSILAIGEQVAVYNAADGTRTALHTTPGTNGKVLRAAFSSAHLLWVGRRNETGTIDLRDGTTQLFPTLAGRMLEFYENKIYTGNSSTISRVSLEGTVEGTLPGFTNLDGHWLGRSPF